MRDKEIVELFWSRSESAIERAGEKYGRYLLTVAGRILPDEREAEEAVNDAYLGAWNAIPPHRPEDLRTFLAKIARREALKVWRRGRAEKRGGGETRAALEELSECIPSNVSPEAEVEAGELARAVSSFLRGLSETERAVFVRRYWYLEPIDDVARRFGFTKSKVKSMLMRTRRRLRDYLVREEYIDE